MGIWKITSMSIIFYFGGIGNWSGGLVSGSGSGSIVYAYYLGWEAVWIFNWLRSYSSIVPFLRVDTSSGQNVECCTTRKPNILYSQDIVMSMSHLPRTTFSYDVIIVKTLVSKRFLTKFSSIGADDLTLQILEQSI